MSFSTFSSWSLNFSIALVSRFGVFILAPKFSRVWSG
jgi:hypothetical protein